MAGIFVVGCQRSGTTALYRALDAHPNLVQQSGSEQRPDGTKKELWFFQEFFRGRESNPHRPHCPSDIDTEYQHRFARMVDDYCTERYAKGSKRWISAHPRDGLYIDRILPLFPEQDIRVLFLVRHPQEVVWSSLCAPWANKNLSTKEMLNEAARGAKYWSCFGPNALAARDGQLGENVKLVHHHELLQNPREIMREVLEFVDEPFDERVIDEISVTSDSSFKDQTARIEDLKRRAAEISENKKFCAVVASFASPYMEELGFQNYGNDGDYSQMSRVLSHGKAKVTKMWKTLRNR